MNEEPDVAPADSYTVLSHVHDEEAGVYRLVVGRALVRPASIREVLVTDDEGRAFVDDESPQTTVEEVPAEVVGYVDVEDFVFADHDEQWKTKKGAPLTHSAIAARQRELVRAALDERAALEPELSATVELPGTGEAL